MQIDDDLRKRVVGLLRKSRSAESGYRKDEEALKAVYAIDGEKLIPIARAIIAEHHSEIEDTDLACDAAEILVKIDPVNSKEFIEGFLNSPNEYVREQFCRLLSLCGDNNTVVLLIDRLLNDEVPEVRFMASFVLEDIGDERALPALQWAKKHDTGKDWEGRGMQEYAQYAIDEILKRTGGLDR